MKVSQILTLVEGITGAGVSRETDMLPVLDARVKELYSGFSTQRVYFDSSTGKHPLLATQNNILEYAFPAWAAKIVGIYDDSLSFSDQNEYSPVPAQADESSRLIHFFANPGDSTTQYRIVGIALQTDMTSENDNLCAVPEKDRFPLLVCSVVSVFKPNHPTFGLKAWDKAKLEFREGLYGSTSQNITREAKWPAAWGYREDGQTPSDYREG